VGGGGAVQVVARSMSLPVVGGSDDCLGVIVKGHQQVGDLLTTAEGASACIQ
jgi:hypothetical protein